MKRRKSNSNDKEKIQTLTKKQIMSQQMAQHFVMMHENFICILYKLFKIDFKRDFERCMAYIKVLFEINFS